MGLRTQTVRAIMLGVALSAMAVTAHAQSRPRTDAVVAGTLTEDSGRTGRDLQWGDDGRWGLNLDVDRPVGREADWSDVDAGAYVRLSPSVRVGGSVALGERRADPGRPQRDPRSQPRVRLETIFRF